MNADRKIGGCDNPQDRPRFIGTVQHNGCLVIYRQHGVNHCPGCGHSQWIVGRITADCALCGTVIPLASWAVAGAGARNSEHFSRKGDGTCHE